MTGPRLVLASASPRRRALLEQMGLQFDVVVTDVDESVHPGEAPAAYVERLARSKARAGFSAGCVVLGADTTVAVDDEILGTHCLMTGDVNRDGKPDLIANSGRAAKKTSIPNSLTWLEVPKNPRTAKNWIRHVFAKGDAPGGSHYTGFGDVNGDGLPDISCAAKGGDRFPGGQWFAWWEQSKDGKLPWKKHLLADKQPGATNILPADLDGDKHIDYFATRGHGQGVLWFKGPDFKLIEIDPKILVPHSLDLADLDNDGDIDAVTCSKDPVDVAAWYENNGKGQFTKRIIGRKQGSYDTRAIDMDADGDLDVLIAGHTSNNVVWFENPLGKEKISHASGGFLDKWFFKVPKVDLYADQNIFGLHCVQGDHSFVTCRNTVRWSKRSHLQVYPVIKGVN